MLDLSLVTVGSFFRQVKGFLITSSSLIDFCWIRPINDRRNTNISRNSWGRNKEIIAKDSEDDRYPWISQWRWIEERRSGNSSRSGNAVHDFSEQKSRYHLGFSLYKTTCASSLRGDIGLLECSYFICVMLIKFSTRDWIFSSPCRAQAFVFVQNPLCLSGISFFEFSTRDKVSFSNVKILLIL